MILSCGVSPFPAVDKENDRIGLRDRGARLLRHRMHDSRRRLGSKPPVSTTRYGRSPPSPAPEVAIAPSDPDSSATSARAIASAVEQRRFSDVGAADDDEGW